MVDILEMDGSTMVLGPRRGWGTRIADSKIYIDCMKKEITVENRLLGRSTIRVIPFAKVNSVRMSKRHGSVYLYSVRPSHPMLMYDNPKTRFDLWIDAMELGKIVLGTRIGLRFDGEDIEHLGRRVADFMRKPFVDTTKW